MSGAEGFALGARPAVDGVRFTAWSDKAARLAVVLYDAPGRISREIPLSNLGDSGLFSAVVSGVQPGALYDFRLDGSIIAVDPYARELPFGVHGPARVAFELPPLQNPKRAVDLDAGEVLYELHIGTFTLEGTLRAAAERLSDLRELGVTVVELMPIAAFAGARGWGYDGVGLFAPFAGYGTPEDVRAFLEAAHAQELGVLLDVVYNHLGPAGNALPTFSDRYFHPDRKNPWGNTPNLESGAFRQLVTDNAQYWLENVGFDGLRLDATHELEPGGTPHVLNVLSDVAKRCSPRAVLIAEDSRNFPHALLEHGIDGFWSDDFHHAVHVFLTGERDGYYGGYSGTLEDLARTIVRGQLYEGQRTPGQGSPRGQSCDGVPLSRFSFALQNHDQIGNRAQGDRLNALTTPAIYRAVSLLLLFLPETPLLFMGQEWASEQPFMYFSDHEGELGAAVTRGRFAEFGHFFGFAKDAGSVPDPQSEATFARSKLDWESREKPESRATLSLYRNALQLRRRDVVLARPGPVTSGVHEGLLWVLRKSDDQARLLVFNPGPARSLGMLAGHDLAAARPLLASCDLREPGLPAESSVIFEMRNP